MSCRALALFLLGACSYSPPGDATTTDAAGDGLSSDGPIEVGPHLAITEICVEGSVEFIEIHNPATTAVDLTTYYLTDANEYWRTPGLPTATIAVLSSDFLVKFPDGASIAGGAVITVAINGTSFESEHGTPPTYTIGVGPPGGMMVEIVQPDQPALESRLSDDGELLVLFAWDGESDLVTDVDIVVHGMPTSAGNLMVAKEPIDGPDPDTIATAYAADARTAIMSDRGPDDDRFSYKRIALEAAAETASGGNGISGHDETSEDLQMTWNTGSMPSMPGTFLLP